MTSSSSAGRPTGWRAVYENFLSRNYTVPGTPYCFDSSGCFAIDGHVIERTTNGGSTWGTSANVVLSSTASTVLVGISCSGGVTCVVVGNSTGTRNGRSVSGPDALVLSERVGRKHWHVIGLGASKGVSINVAGVSCGTASSCVAVGSYNGGASNEGGVVWYTIDAGRSWHNLRPPSSVGALSAVSCTSAKFCVAASSSAMIVTTRGPTGFAVAQSPASWAHLTTNVNALACAPGTRSCVAVGNYQPSPQNPNRFVPVIATSDGGVKWSSVGGLPAIDGSLAGVACPSAGTCVAGGYQAGKALGIEGATFLLQGTAGTTGWRPISVPKPTSSAPLDGFFGITCPTTSFCLATPASSLPYELIGPA